MQEYQTRLFAQPFEAKTGIKVNIGSNASLALVKLQNVVGHTGPVGHLLLERCRVLRGHRPEADRALRLQHRRHHQYRARVQALARREVLALSLRDGMGQASDPRRQGSPDACRVLGHQSLQGQALALRRRLGRQHAGNGAASRRRASQPTLSARRRPRLAQPGAARPRQHHLAQHQCGADPAAHFRCGFAGQLLQRTRDRGEPVRRPARLHSGLQRGERQSLLRDRQLGQQEGGVRVSQLPAQYTARPTRSTCSLRTTPIPNTEALKLVPADILDILPTSPKLKDKVFIKDDAWWAANLAKK